MNRMRCLLILTCLLTVVFTTDSWARRSYVTPEQKAELLKIKTIYLEVLALTENGRASPVELQQVAKQRLEEVGFTVVTNAKDAHDVEVKVKCEERKRWAGTTRSGGDAELANSPARLWKGPACLFAYRLNGEDLGWYKETRTDFQDAQSASQAAQVSDSGLYAMSQLKIKLEQFDFPLMLATEWGHTARLANLLESPNTSKARKLRILSILSKIKSKEAFPYLVELARDENREYATEAILALGGIGSASIPMLTELLGKPDSLIQAAAAKSLGIIGAHTGDPQVTPPLLEYLTNNLQHMNSSEDIDFPVLTEVVWALGKLRNENSIAPVEELNRKIWLIRDTSEAMSKLRDAANVATKMIDLDYQIM